MVEIAVTGGKLNLFLELVHRAGSFDGFNGSAIRADQVITMLAGEQQGELGGTLMEPKPAQDALVSEALEQAKNGSLVTLLDEVGRFTKFGEGHRPIALQQGSEQFLQCGGAAQAFAAAACNDGVEFAGHESENKWV